MSDLPEGFVLEHHEGVALLRLNAGKANAMSPEFITDLIKVAMTLKNQPEPPRALVLTGTGRAFSAGLALPRIIDHDRDELRSFMQLFGVAMESVLTLPMPTVAAINGHAIAGGCVLALMCDYRLMVSGPAKIGLNEVAIGIGLPASVIEPLRVRVPARSLTPIALAGALFSPEEALSLDLIDDMFDGEELEGAAIERAQALALAPAAVAQVKAALLRPVLAQMHEHEDAELEAWLDTWFSDEAQETLTAAVASLG